MRLCFVSGWLLLLVTPSVLNKSVETPRYLVYPPPGGSATKVQLIFGLGIPMEVDVSTIVGYVMKCNYNLPYNASYLSEAYVRYERSAVSEELIDQESGQLGRLERADVYQMIEAAISSASAQKSEGKPCLLRAICDLAATPFHTSHHLFAQLLSIFLTPSSTREPIDQQYLAAERMGSQSSSSRQCAHAFPECRANFLEYFSEIH